MNVVFVAPDAPPGYQPVEVQGLVASLEDAGCDVFQVAGPVVQKRVVAGMRKGCDVFVWLGHGEPGRLLLPDGSGVGARWLAFTLADACVPVAVLAACGSADRPRADLLAAFSDELPAAGIDTVTMAGAVAVDVASRYVVALLAEMIAGRELRQAHQTGLEAVRAAGLEAAAPEIYRADQRKRDLPMPEPTTITVDGRVETSLQTINQKLDKMNDQLHDLDTRQRLLEAKVETLAGSMETRQRTLEAKVETMAGSMKNLETTIQALRSPSSDFSRSWLLAVAAGIIIVLVLLIFITSRLV